MSYIDASTTQTQNVDPSTIVIVENNLVLRDLLKTILQHGGYTCVEAKDGLDALAVIPRHVNIRAIISDFEMPNLDGLQLLRALKQMPQTRYIPFLFVTGNQSRTFRTQAKREGAFVILEKPFRLEELLDQLNRTIAPHATISEFSEGKAWDRVTR